MMTMTIAQWFTIANLFVLPFWTLMILLPNWDWTRRVLASYLPFVGLALLYGVLLIGALTPETMQAMANPQLSELAQLFASEQATAIAWVHFLLMDLFVGRWIYWEGQRTGLWTTHSLILCLFAGPVGLLSHILTSAIADRFAPESDPVLPTPPQEASSSSNS